MSRHPDTLEQFHILELAVVLEAGVDISSLVLSRSRLLGRSVIWSGWFASWKRWSEKENSMEKEMEMERDAVWLTVVNRSRDSGIDDAEALQEEEEEKLVDQPHSTWPSRLHTSTTPPSRFPPAAVQHDQFA